MIIPILPLLNVEQCVVICSNNVIHITLAAWKEIFASSFIPSEFKPLFHCIPVLQIITEIGRVFIMLLYPPLNEVEGGYTGFTLSVRLRIILHVVLHVMAGMRRIGNAEIFSALSPRYGWNAEIMRRFLRIPVRILPSAFSPHFLRIFFHIGTRRNTRRFLRVPVRILPSAFSPHFFPHFLPYKNAEISPRSCPNTPIRIFSARKMRRSGVRGVWKLTCCPTAPLSQGPCWEEWAQVTNSSTLDHKLINQANVWKLHNMCTDMYHFMILMVLTIVVNIFICMTYLCVVQNQCTGVTVYLH